MAKKAKHHQYTFSTPCCERMMQQIREVIAGLRDLPYEHLIVDLENKPGGMQFIQTVRLEDDGDFRVEIAMDCGKEQPQIFCLDDVSQADTIALFEQVCAQAQSVDLSGWKDITRDVFWKEMKMKVFKEAYLGWPQNTLSDPWHALHTMQTTTIPSRSPKTMCLRNGCRSVKRSDSCRMFKAAHSIVSLR